MHHGRVVVALSLLCIPSLSIAQDNACDLRAPGSRDASWSPDGERIAFSSTRSGSSDIYSMRSDGSEVERLTQWATDEYYPFYSPDGGRIVFMNYRDASVVVHTMDADGSSAEQLTELGAENADPSWSPDGKSILYYSGSDNNSEIYRMDADGSNRIRLTQNDALDQTPSYSPGGSLITFVSDRDGARAIYTMTSDGSGIKRVSDEPYPAAVPSWAADGKSILFYTRMPPDPNLPQQEAASGSWSTAEIRQVILETGETRRLTNNDVLDQSPSMSPDGKLIAYTSCQSGNREIWVMNIDGSNQRRLTVTTNVDSGK